MKINILGSGRVLPKTVKYSTEIDKLFDKKEGTTEKKTGIVKRHFHNGAASEIAKDAILLALEEANLSYKDLDVIIAASGTPEQIIPCNASLIAERFINENHNIPCFDVNATCLSFLSAFDVAAAFLETKKYRNILVVSAEAGDGALNPEEFESYALIGNGSAAFILSTDESSKKTKGAQFRIVNSLFKTYPKYVHTAEIKSGGSREYFLKHNVKKDFYFTMNGTSLVRAMMKEFGPFMKEFFENTDIELSDINYIVPHQASGPGIRAIARMFKIPDDRIIKTLVDAGNMISASIPFTLDYLLETENIMENEYILLLGTGAGVSIGGLLLQRVK